MSSKIIYVDGVSHLGKSREIGALGFNYGSAIKAYVDNDFIGDSTKIRRYSEKTGATNTVCENLYNNLKRIAIQDLETKYPEATIVVDGSNYTSIFNEAVNKELEKHGAGIEFLNATFKKFNLADLMALDNIIIFTMDEMDIELHLKASLHEKINNIPILRYCRTQIYIFKHVRFLANTSTKFIEMFPGRPSLSISQYILRYISETQKQIPEPVPYSKCFTKSYYEDAGYNLTLTSSKLLHANEAYRLKLAERMPDIPSDCFATIYPRSSILSKGEIRGGVFDSGYTGHLFVTFKPDKTCVVFKGTSICQLVIMQYRNPPHYNISKSLVDKRNNNGLGSTNTKRALISLEDYPKTREERQAFIAGLHEKWNNLDRDSNSEEYTKDMQLLEFFTPK